MQPPEGREKDAGELQPITDEHWDREYNKKLEW